MPLDCLRGRLALMAATQFFGERIKRNEDPRLLTGQALFTDDVDLPEMAHVAFLRSPYAHARILSIDVSAALEREGVIAVYTADSLGDYWQPGPLLVQPPPIKDIVFNQRTQVPLAKVFSLILICNSVIRATGSIDFPAGASVVTR